MRNFFFRLLALLVIGGVLISYFPEHLSLIIPILAVIAIIDLFLIKPFLAEKARKKRQLQSPGANTSIKEEIKTVLTALLGFIAIAGGQIWFFFEKFPAYAMDIFINSFLSALCAVPGILFLFQARESLREMSEIKDSIKGHRPEDGLRAVMVGTIEATGPLLTAPLSGAQCIAYDYEVSRKMDRNRSFYFRGLAIAPAVIKTLTGSYRFLSMPEFDFRRDSLEKEAGLSRTREYVGTTELQPLDSQPRHELALIDGAYRKDEGDLKYLDEAFVNSYCDFFERHVRDGETVCAVGPFSARLSALGPFVRIVKGDIGMLLSKLKRKAALFLAGSLLLLSFAAGFVNLSAQL